MYAVLFLTFFSIVNCQSNSSFTTDYSNSSNSDDVSSNSSSQNYAFIYEPGTNYVQGGEKAVLGQFPSTLAIVVGDNGWFDVSYSPICGAVLLNEYYALTAAHCVYQNSATYYFVGGIINAGDRGVSSPPKRIIIHPEYSKRTERNDIAVIELKSYIVGRNVNPAKLPSSRPRPGPGYKIAGFGQTSPNERTSSKTTLAFLDLKLLPKEHCFFHFPSEICLAPEKSGTGPCFGDSGTGLYGPDGELAGIISRGDMDCNGPDIFTSVYYYADWINKIINNK